MKARVNDKWVQTHGDYRLHVGQRFLPALPQPRRPLHRLPLCLLGMCGGRVESDSEGLWWQCGTCQRVQGYVPRSEWPDPAPRDRDGSGEAGETTQLARPEGQQPGPKASPNPPLPKDTPNHDQ